MARDPLENASTLYGTRDDAQYWTNVVTISQNFSRVYSWIRYWYTHTCWAANSSNVSLSRIEIETVVAHSLAQLSTLNGHSIQYTEKHTDIQLRRQLHKVFWSDDLANERFGSHLFLSLSPYVYISIFPFISTCLSIYLFIFHLSLLLPFFTSILFSLYASGTQWPIEHFDVNSILHQHSNEFVEEEAVAYSQFKGPDLQSILKWMIKRMQYPPRAGLWLKSLKEILVRRYWLLVFCLISSSFAFAFTDGIV